MNLTEVTDLSVIGTLFAFTIVCAGVLVKDKEFAGQNRFVPYISSQFIAPAIFIIIWAALLYYNGEALRTFFTDFSPTADDSSFGVFLHKLPYLVFAVFTVVMTILCFVKRFSLIPI